MCVIFEKMLREKSLQIGIFIVMAIAGIIALLTSLMFVDFNNSSNVKLAILILSFFCYLLIILVIILFLKAYEVSESKYLPQEIKTKQTLLLP